MTTIKSQRLKQRESASKWNYRVAARQKVVQRFEAGGCRCEGCGRVVDIVEAHHAFGRGNQVADKYASTPELMAALCCSRSYGMTKQGCHELLTLEKDPDLKAQVQWRAVGRFAAKHFLLPDIPSGADPLGVIRRMVDEVESDHPPNCAASG